VVCEWPATASAPEWTDDLDSLFRLVDERMVERRVVWAPEDAPEDGDGVSEPVGSAAALAEDGRGGPPPTDTPGDCWIGFGIAEETGETFAADAAEGPAEGPVPPSDEFVARVLVTGLLDSFKAELRALVEATVRDAVDAAVKDQVRNAVREFLAETVCEAVQDAASPARSSPALVSILVRRPVFRPRDAATREPAATFLRLRSTSR
jgi:hypothetical protein